MGRFWGRPPKSHIKLTRRGGSRPLWPNICLGSINLMIHEQLCLVHRFNCVCALTLERETIELGRLESVSFLGSSLLPPIFLPSRHYPIISNTSNFVSHFCFLPIFWSIWICWTWDVSSPCPPLTLTQTIFHPPPPTPFHTPAVTTTINNNWCHEWILLHSFLAAAASCTQQDVVVVSLCLSGQRWHRGTWRRQQRQCNGSLFFAYNGNHDHTAATCRLGW